MVVGKRCSTFGLSFGLFSERFSRRWFLGSEGDVDNISEDNKTQKQKKRTPTSRNKNKKHTTKNSKQ